jgi:quinol monooxygenase YgiN
MQQNNTTNENSKVRVIVISEVKEGKRQELLDLLDPVIESSRKEEGNISYDLYSSTEKHNEFLLDELWSSKETFDKHYKSPEAYKAREGVSSILVKPLQIKTYTEVNKM